MSIRPYQVAVSEIGENGANNAIINGQMDVWQRASGFSSVANNTYGPDRFVYTKNGTMVNNLQRDVGDAPSSPLANKAKDSLQVQVAISQPVLGAGHFFTIDQRIEGYFMRSHNDEVCTLSFWVKSNKLGTYCVAFRNLDNSMSYVTTYVINASNTWEFKQVVVPLLASVLNSPVSLTQDTSGLKMTVSWTLAAGTNLHTTANAWNPGNFLATAAQVNLADSTLNTWNITAIDFRVGDYTKSQLPTYSPRSYMDELRLCQRYYEKSYDIDVVPGTISVDGFIEYFTSGLPIQIRAGLVQSDFLVSKRDIPTVSIYSNTTGAINKLHDSSTGSEITPFSVVASMRNIRVVALQPAPASGVDFVHHWTSASEL